MSINRKIIEMISVPVCLSAGLGSILFGALSGNRYGYLFVAIGALVLALTIFYNARTTAIENENKNKNEV